MDAVHAIQLFFNKLRRGLTLFVISSYDVIVGHHIRERNVPNVATNSH